MKIRGIKDKHRRLNGRVSTLKRMMEKRKERIINNKREIWELQKELDIRQKQLKKVTVEGTIKDEIRYIFSEYYCKFVCLFYQYFYYLYKNKDCYDKIIKMFFNYDDLSFNYCLPI